MWGNYMQTGGKEGEAPEMEPVKELVALNKAWQGAESKAEKEKIWRRMLEIQADQVFTIGIVNSTLQPVVVNDACATCRWKDSTTGSREPISASTSQIRFGSTARRQNNQCLPISSAAFF